MKTLTEIAGYTIVVIGVWVVLHTLLHWNSVPQAFMRVDHDVVRLVPAKPPDDPHTGPTRVVNMWHYTEKGREDTPTGDYQFKDNDGVVLTLHFCDSPPPEFDVDSVVDVHFQYSPDFQKDKCVRFAWAKLLGNK